MPYSVDISGLDFSSGVGDIRVTAGYTFTELGGPHGSVERRQDEVTLDITPVQFQPGPATFGYAGDLAPQPSPAWFIALWIQEVARIANDDGWLFRSGRRVEAGQRQLGHAVIERRLGACHGIDG